MHALAGPARSARAPGDIEVASAEVPSGSAWLVNCLIELGVPAWRPWGSDDRAHWLWLGGSRYRYVGGDNGWSRVLPALRDGREFTFRGDRCLRAHHALPTILPAAASRLLFVRDPLDALYSAWRRRCRSTADALARDFAAFCASPFFHFPICWADYLLLFLRVWRQAASASEVKVVRFEDYRSDARATLLDVVRHLGIDAGTRAIDAAIDASSVERAQAEDQRLLRAGVVDTLIVRGAPPGEHERYLDPATRSSIASRFVDISDWLGYAPVPAPEPAPMPASAPEDVHAAVIAALHQAGAHVAADSWLWMAVRDATAGIDLVPGRAE